ncbi:hypothetical protein [Geomonas sp. Red276]
MKKRYVFTTLLTVALLGCPFPIYAAPPRSEQVADARIADARGGGARGGGGEAHGGRAEFHGGGGRGGSPGGEVRGRGEVGEHREGGESREREEHERHERDHHEEQWRGEGYGGDVIIAPGSGYYPYYDYDEEFPSYGPTEYLYYCENPPGYYPSVPQCPEGWEVIPR